MAISTKFTLNRGGLAQAVTGPQGAAVLHALRAGRLIANSAKMKAPVDKGVLRNSISYDPAPTVAGMKVTTRVTASANYAKYVHDGVKGGNVIRPKNGQFLKFQIGGREVFARSVVQGPQKARPFLRNAAEEQAPRLGFSVGSVP